MSDYIQMAALDLSVYGQVQSQYIIDGVRGGTYEDAAINGAFRRAAAMEEESRVVSAALKKRAKKMEDLGQAMAYVNEFIAINAKVALSDNSKKNGLLPAYVLMKPYNADARGYVNDKGQCSKPDALKLQTDLQLVIDKENNSIQQDTNSLQSFMSKRDQAYTTVSKLMQKLRKATTKTIENIGEG